MRWIEQDLLEEIKSMQVGGAPGQGLRAELEKEAFYHRPLRCVVHSVGSEISHLKRSGTIIEGIDNLLRLP